MDRLALIKTVASGRKLTPQIRTRRTCCLPFQDRDIERERLEEIIETSRVPTPRRRAKRIDEYDDSIPGLDDKIAEGMKILHSDEEDD